MKFLVGDSLQRQKFRVGLSLKLPAGMSFLGEAGESGNDVSSSYSECRPGVGVKQMSAAH